MRIIKIRKPDDVIVEVEGQQSTELFDTNGTKVFEGDMIEFDNFFPEKHEVVFHEGNMCLKFDDSGFYKNISYVKDGKVI